MKGKEKENYLKNNYSVLFAIKKNNQKFEIDDEFVSSQELFSRYFNKEHQKLKTGTERRVHIEFTDQYLPVSNFLKN